MNCRECLDFLSDYRNGELPDEQRAVFETHLSKCPPCRDFLDSYCESIRMAKDCCCPDPDGPVPDKVPDALVNAILKARDASRDS